MEIREPEPAESDRIREVADSSMTTHYRLSPDQIGEITDEVFADEETAERLEAEEDVLRVAEVEDEEGEPTVAGVVTGSVEGTVGTLEWLFVDPEHPGEGIGTELFETAEAALADEAEYVRVGVVEPNMEGHDFVERFEYERVGEHSLDVAGNSLVEYVYADPGVEPEAVLETTEDDEAFPDTEERGDDLVATTAEGEEVFVARDEEESGTEASFYVTYVDAAREEPSGFYCSNCGSLETAMNEMERIECSNCGNHHTSKSRESYDDSFL